MTSASAQRSGLSTRGVVFVHACPAAIAPHVEWAMAAILSRPAKMTWTGQPAAPAHLRSELSWVGPVGTGARLAASLRAWPMLVFEVTEQPTSGSDGERLAYVPGRGFHRSLMSANGDILVAEERLRGLLERSKTADDFNHGLHELLGTPWDVELEPYRHAGEGSPVSLLHQVV